MIRKYEIRRVNKRYRIVYRTDRRYAWVLLIFALLFIFVIKGKSNEEPNITGGAEIIKLGLIEEMEENTQNEKISLLGNILLAQLGKPYVYNKEGPDSFDCSGLVRYAYGQIGIDLPRAAANQAEAGETVERKSLRFGDLLFFSDKAGEVTHTGIYVGKGYMIHAPKTGDVVKLAKLDTAYFNKVFVKAVRILY